MKWIAFKGYNLVIGVYFDRIIYYFETVMRYTKPK